MLQLVAAFSGHIFILFLLDITICLHDNIDKRQISNCVCEEAYFILQ